MSFVLYAPNVHLFAFHLWEIDEAEVAPDYPLHYLQDCCKEIFQRFGIPQEALKLRTVNSNRPLDILLEGTNEENILLNLEGKLEDKKITGVFTYLQLYDSYGLYLNLRIPELDEHQNRTQPVDVSIFNKFNQNQQFIVESSIGQVVILTGWLSKEQQQQTLKDWQKLADRCVQSFLEKSDCPPPPCYQANQLFGSPVFEYGDPRYPEKYNTIWVWLFFDESKDTEKPFALAESKLADLDLEFLYLFFYRQKVIKTFEMSRKIYRETCQKYKEIKTEVESIRTSISQRDSHKSSLPQSTMSELQQSLVKVLEFDVVVEDNLRSLENNRLTLDANSQNFRTKLEQIQAACPQAQLDFLEHFSETNCPTFKAQMELDLGYFLHTDSFADKAIASIRGIVEIEQTQRDRLRQAQEKSLENTIQALGLAIATGAIFASSAALIDDTWRWPWQSDRSDYPHPFIIAFVGSLLVVCLVYAGVKLWQKWHKPKPKRKTDGD